MDRTPQRAAFTLSDEEELDPEHAALSPGSNGSHRPQVPSAALPPRWRRQSRRRQQAAELISPRLLCLLVSTAASLPT